MPKLGVQPSWAPLNGDKEQAGAPALVVIQKLDGLLSLFLPLQLKMQILDKYLQIPVIQNRKAPERAVVGMNLEGCAHKNRVPDFSLVPASTIPPNKFIPAIFVFTFPFISSL